MTQIYCDGCRKKDGSGGYGAIVISLDGVQIVGGYEQDTTNNQMELQAAIEGLELSGTVYGVEVISDSEYFCKGFNQHLDKWEANGYKTTDKHPVKNKERWVKLLQLKEGREARALWTKGHADVTFNILADRIANFCCIFRQEININYPSVEALLEANERYLRPVTSAS